jgi:glycosyltransferase involved in cell wall biosynthesis
MKPKISIIIPARSVNNYLQENIKACLASTFTNFEIIVLLDKKTTSTFSKTFILDTGHVGPAQKRDIGAKIAQGDILTFIDDDAYPAKEWLKSILPHFNDPDIAAVGGPGITPLNVNFWEAASGWISASPIGSGQFSYRFLPTHLQYVDDYPSMNLSVRKTDFELVGGYDSNYYPGEDTKLCLDLTHRLKKKIIYDPQVIVYHHRRPLFIPHLIQNGNFGIHRGKFARILPETSARFIYFLPSGLLLLTILYVILIILTIFQQFLIIYQTNLFYIISIIYLCYIIMLIVNSVWIWRKSGEISQALISIPGVYITHLWYGIRFIQGFGFTVNLKQ